MDKIRQIRLIMVLSGLALLMSFQMAHAGDMVVGMLSKVSGRTITVTTSAGASKDVRVRNSAYITDLTTRQKIVIEQLRPGSKVRVSSRGSEFMAVEVLEVPK